MISHPKALADLQNLLTQVHAIRGGFRHYDEIDISDDRSAPNGAGTYYGLIIGERGILARPSARRAAAAFRKIATKHPNAVVGLAIAGYDDDKREIPDIPEACEHYCRFARFAGLDSLADAMASPLHPHSVGLLAKCGCFPEVDPDDVPVVPIPA